MIVIYQAGRGAVKVSRGKLLEDKGMLVRIHGGALPLQQVGFTVPKKYTPRDIVDIKERVFPSVYQFTHKLAVNAHTIRG